jgi:formylglycine-generating enzyme required for sulfatase activity
MSDPKIPAIPAVQPDPPARRSGRKGWSWAAVGAALVVVWIIIANFGPSRSHIKFLDAPALGKSYRARAGINMVWIAPGSFQMGDSMGSGGSDEKPVHEVRLTTGYWLGESDVTQEQWQVVMGSNPSAFVRDNLPVQDVSWHDAVEFCQRLTQRERAAAHLLPGMEYCLPTEAQWEYACRAGTTGDYAGNLDAMAWYDLYIEEGPHVVKTKRPNAWGLYDMHGNVSEWCSDWYGNYSAGTQVDPTGPSNGADRVTRGGAWDYTGKDCRSASRYKTTPEGSRNELGFRLAAVPSSGL